MSNSPPDLLPTPPRTVLLLAKASITGAAVTEMERLSAQLHQALAAQGTPGRVVYAFSEQGTPSLRDAWSALGDSGCNEVWLLPLLVPMEPGFSLWITRSLQRWRAAEPQRAWPLVRLAPELAALPALAPLLAAMAAATAHSPPLPQPQRLVPEGSTVPAQQVRVLVCQGAPCNNAGAAVVWGHLRNVQKQRGLRTEGRGVMTCKTSCLGPCNLAPVLQVFPDGTYYGGVDEAGIDRIVEEHLLGGKEVQALAYAPGAGKQRLR